MRKNKKGFTLAELLIVVAIIAVLVGVAIPIFTGQLEKARVATDQSNVRSAKAAAASEYMSNGMTGEMTYYYDPNVSGVKKTSDGISGYGKSSKEDADGSITGAKGNPKDAFVAVTIHENGDIEARWVDGDSKDPEDFERAKKVIEMRGTEWRKVGSFNPGARIYDEDTGNVHIAMEYLQFNGDKSTYKNYEEHYDHLDPDKKAKIATVTPQTRVYDYNSIASQTKAIERGTVVENNNKFYVCRTNIEDISKVSADELFSKDAKYFQVFK